MNVSVIVQSVVVVIRVAVLLLVLWSGYNLITEPEPNFYVRSGVGVLMCLLSLDSLVTGGLLLWKSMTARKPADASDND